MRKLLLFAMAVIFSGSMMAQFNVTMNVDMTDLEGFDPATHTVYVSGSIFGWAEPGSTTDLMLTQVDETLVYTITAEVAGPGEVQYKFFTDAIATGWAGGEWEGDPNRKVYVTGETTINDIWGDKPFEVTFMVDMTNAPEFSTDTASIFMGGTVNMANNWNMPGTDSSLMMMPSAADPLVYELTLLLNAGDYAYKYFFVNNETPSWDNGEWTGDPNREVSVDTVNYMISDVWAVQANMDEMVIADFEDETTGPLTLHVMGCGEWDNAEIHPVEETFAIIDNPDKSGMNTSDKVMQFNRRGLDEEGQPWGGFWANADPMVDATNNKYVHVMVWKPRVSPVKFKLEGGPSGTSEIFSSNEQSETGMWVDMVFPFDTMTGAYPVVAFMPDFEEPFTAAELQVIYFDNIRINNDPNPFDDSGIFDGASYVPAVSIFPNPCNASLNVIVENNMQSIAVYNLMGQQQKTFGNVAAGNLTIDTSDLPTGIYMLVLRDDNNKLQTVKFAKE